MIIKTWYYITSLKDPARRNQMIKKAPVILY